MKNKIYREDFENFLKENANDFLMVPSRKVWYSIYNDMHPDRKWPSMAVCLLILSAVLYIGVSNNNSLSIAARKANAGNLSGIDSNVLNNNTSPLTAMQQPGLQNISINNAANENNILPSQQEDDINGAFPGDAGDNAGNNIQSVNDKVVLVPSTGISLSAGARSSMNILPAGASAEELAATALRNTVKENNPSSGTDAPNIDLADSKKVAPKKNTAEIANTITTDNDLAWKEDYAFRNKPLEKKFRKHASIEYYITPSFGYRGFFNSNKQRIAALNGETRLNDGGALNLELGAALRYKVSRNVRLTSGLQLNYTNYISKVTALQHPTQTALAVSDENVFRSSDYAVKSGSGRLNKTTFQIAMPLGADVRIAGHKKLQWHAGATIQPTYVASGSAYVLSADGKNYISETPLLRKWNMNAGFETFVSFKPATGVTLNVGPQFRYQLLSTYKKEYNYTEKLYNVGVKIGITTDF